jgi:hypothetical protein
MKVKFNNLIDVYEALQQDLITPSKAVEIVTVAYNMIDVRFTQSNMTKDSVLNQIMYLNDLVIKGENLPIFFFSKGQFSIKDIFKN